MPKLLCVYCSSSDRLDPKYFAAAETFGRAMTARGWGLVYGGGKTGLMGAVARGERWPPFHRGDRVAPGRAG